MKSKNKAEKFWDRMARNYNKEEKQDEPVLLKIIENSRKHLTKRDDILDFGCGTGLASNMLAQYVKSLKGVDISSRMIAFAKAKAIKKEIRNIEYEHTTIFDARYKTQSFDAVLSFYILHLIEDPQEAVNRLSDLIKPGGLFISATPCMGERKLLKGIFSIGGHLGLIPRIKSFKYTELIQLIENGSFEIIETEHLHLKSHQYFIVARKIS